jgi:hypothetical protein
MWLDPFMPFGCQIKEDRGNSGITAAETRKEMNFDRKANTLDVGDKCESVRVNSLESRRKLEGDDSAFAVRERRFTQNFDVS